MNADGVESGPDPGRPSAEQPDSDDELVAPRSHRRGMLAGLGVVGLLLAGLLLFGPGGTRPRPAAQGQDARSPVTIPIRSDPTPAGSSTTSTSAPAAPAPKTGPVTDLAASTYQVSPSRPTHASTPTPIPAHSPSTTVPLVPAPATTTTTAPVATTTTTTSPPATTTTSCILILCD